MSVAKDQALMAMKLKLTDALSIIVELKPIVDDCAARMISPRPNQWTRLKKRIDALVAPQTNEGHS